jgi:hypothetical protein
MWVACLKILGFDETGAETPDKPQNVSQAGGEGSSGEAPHLPSSLAFHVPCLPIVKADPAVGRNCFQMTLWEKKTRIIKKLQNKKQNMHALWARISYGLFPDIVQ